MCVAGALVFLISDDIQYYIK